MAEDSTPIQSPSQTPERHGWGDVLKHRWPTLLGVLLLVLTVFDLKLDQGFVSFLAALVIFMALIYLGAAVLGQRSSAWLVFGVGLVLITILRQMDMNLTSIVVFLAAALVFLVVGAVTGRWRTASSLPLETVGMLVFSAIALIALNLDLNLAGYLLAAGLLGHAIWDGVHLWQNRVVARSYAEFCAVLDVLLGVTILVIL